MATRISSQTLRTFALKDVSQASAERPNHDVRSAQRPISYVHELRAIACLLVIAYHCLVEFNWQGRPLTHAILLDLFANASLLFVFISGFLFESRSEAFSAGTFLKKRLLYVILPYIIVSLPAVIHAVWMHDPTQSYPQLAERSSAYQVLWFVLRGGSTVLYPLWFVPMIALIFLVSPLLVKLKDWPQMYWLLVVLIPLGALAHRTKFPYADTVQLAIYYLPVYIAGMAASHFRAFLEPRLRRNAGPLLALFLAMLAAQVTWGSHHGLYEGAHLFSRENGLVDWSYLQKLLLCGALMGLLLRAPSLDSRVLRVIGQASFTLFLVHAYWFLVLRRATDWNPPEGHLLHWLALTAAIMGASVLFAVVARKAMGRYSRFMIGS